MASTTQDRDGEGHSEENPSRASAANSLRASPSRREELERDAESHPAKARRRQFVNAIAPSEVPRKAPSPTAFREAPARDKRAPAQSGAERLVRRNDRAMPEDIKRRFVPSGNVYYFPDGARAFVDRGDRITTRTENTEVIKSLVSIAQARGWEDVTVTGTQRFKREIWLAAKLAGLAVRGHTPDQFEEARLVRALGRTPEPAGNNPPAARSGSSSSGDSTREHDSQRRRAAEQPNAAATGKRQLAGRMIDHGAAPYMHRPNQPMSYFVKLETRDGEREVWGVDLHRALRESLTRPEINDQVVLRQVHQEKVTVRSVERDADGNVLKDEPLAAHRNRWTIEKREFFKDRAEAARTVRDPNVDAKQATARHPELLGTYLQLHAAEIAAKRFANSKDQRKFVSLVRSALADSVARGDPLEPIRVRDNAPTREPQLSRNERERAPEPVRG